MTKKEKTLQWLKDNGVYKQFVKNVEKRPIFIDWNFIASAFIWEDTPEGPSFWSKIDDEYSHWYHEEFDDEFLYK